jgi:uncharacterized protein (TIGR01319 family)
VTVVLHGSARAHAGLAVCVDVGSTFTKAGVVDVERGELLASASHPTTVDTDVLDGVDALFASLSEALPGADLSRVLACSSAGGGLRLAVVGYEREVTAEAGRRVGLSAGARIVHVAAGSLDSSAMAQLRAARPDMLLLVGGTDGGNADVLLHNAAALAAARLALPVVVAGNVAVRDSVCALLDSAGQAALPTANVLPRIGVLDPMPARRAVREVFLRHVIGGKGLSTGTRFADMVRGATPDLVLTGVELLADGAGDVPGVGDVVVVDVGGATTDVYSVVTPDPEEASLRREVVEVLWRSRTVEGDLGMRWNAPGVVEAARAERLLGPGDSDLASAADRRAADPGYLADTLAETMHDERLAVLAATVALRRHARQDTVDGRGKDLRQVRLVVGSGGVLRHADPARSSAVLRAALTDYAGGWLLPEQATPTVDTDYVLAAAGLLASEHPRAAAKLLRSNLVPPAALQTGRD